MNLIEMVKQWMYLPMVGSSEGKQVDLLLLLIHVVMVGLFVGWSVYFLYVLWRFRANRNPKADYIGTTTHASTYVEVTVAVAELALLFGLAVPFWARAVDQFPDPAESTVIRVTGRQFNWIARYPGPDGVFGKQDLRLVSQGNPLGLVARDPARAAEDPTGKDDVVLESSEMAVPVNKPVIIHLSSLDVIHSFKVVPLRVTQDATPGMVIPIHFLPTSTNTYHIQCSQLCGAGHYSMRGVFKVLGDKEYQAWLSANAPRPKVPDAKAQNG